MEVLRKTASKWMTNEFTHDVSPTTLPEGFVFGPSHVRILAKCFPSATPASAPLSLKHPYMASQPTPPQMYCKNGIEISSFEWYVYFLHKHRSQIWDYIIGNIPARSTRVTSGVDSSIISWVWCTLWYLMQEPYLYAKSKREFIIISIHAFKFDIAGYIWIDIDSGSFLPTWTARIHHMPQGLNSSISGMVILPSIRNPYNGKINFYYLVDDHPLLSGNGGSLDPSAYDDFSSTDARLLAKSPKNQSNPSVQDGHPVTLGPTHHITSAKISKNKRVQFNMLKFTQVTSQTNIISWR